MSPYTLPDGNVQIAFSGGRTSAYMLHQILEANGALPDRARVLFTNTGRELPKTLDFVQECGQRWGVNIACLEYRAKQSGNGLEHGFAEVSFDQASQNGEPFIDVMRYFGYVPNMEADFCSHELKTRTARRYCTDVLCWEQWTTALGIRADEAGRVLKKQPKERYRVWYPMHADGVTKHDVALFWRKQPFDLQLANIKGKTPLGNCDGCFKKAESNRAALARDYPERAAWWAEQENRFGGEFRLGQPWGGLIRFVDRQGDWIFSDEASAAGVLCQADGGECT